MQKPPVLVVGAGPVGLTAAVSLARFGVPVRIIDRNAAPSRLSKALVIWRRSLHTLDSVIPYEAWQQNGRNAWGLHLADSGAVFAGLSLCPQPDTAAAQQHMLPPGLMITQAQIEAGLERLLQDTYHISVQRSTQLESFAVDDSTGQVSCVLKPTDPAAAADADKEVLAASYLIGCDGARSAVRKSLGIDFPGFSDPDNRFVMMDCTYEVQPGINPHSPASDTEGRPQPDAPFASTTAEGLLLVIPVVDSPDTIRIAWNAGRDGPEKPTLDDFQAVLLRNTRLQVKLKEALWQSEFSVNERQVESYVHHGGRVLLAGDAAHVHSPAGGQGMNTGIQDGTNLAFKVALAVAGDVASASQLLETYQEERHPAGEDAVRLSGGLLRANSIRNPVLRLLRRVVLGLLTRLPPVQQRLVATITEDTITYTSSSLAKSAAGVSPHPAAGTAFPDMAISIDGVTRPATDLLRGGQGTFGCLVLLGDRRVDGADSSDSSSSRWPTHWGHWPLHVVSVAQQRGSAGGSAAGGEAQPVGGVVDAWGRLAAQLGGVEGVLVRPDGIIAAAGGAQDVTAWLAAHGFFAGTA